MITVKSVDGQEFNAYLALPPGAEGPGLVVLQEIFGVNKVMRDIADHYASLGFVVAVPDLFWRQQPGVELTDQTDSDWKRAFELYQGLDESMAVRDAASTLELLRNHPACTGRVGAVGFCLGGKLAYLLAVRHKPDCAVGYYGVGIDGALDEAPNLTTPLMLHIAGQDQFCSAEAQSRIHQLLEGNSLVTLHDYKRNDHAFARIGGAHYDSNSAELANLRTLKFFVENLGLPGTSSSGPSLSELWEDHVKYEFETRNTEDTLSTMVEDAYVNHVPVLTGGVGLDHLREFYSKRFIPQMPADTSITVVSRTVGKDTIVDEMIFEFTHDIEMDWMLPGVAPTNKHVRVPTVAIVHFRGEKLAHEHIYWDQASVLVQIGLLDERGLPVCGVETAEKVLNPALESNRLMFRPAKRIQQ